jgi:hypothetical protein
MRHMKDNVCATAVRRQTLSVSAVMLIPFAALRVNSAKHPCSLSLDGERKRQLQTRRGGFARPKAGRAQDDRQLQIRNSG